MLSNRNMKMNMAKFIKELRKKKEISQEEIANLLGLTRQTYSQIETGEREITISEAQKIADIFNINLSDLMQGKEIETEVLLGKKKNTSHKGCHKLRESRPQIKVDPERVEKFKQIVLYILEKIGGKPNVGETVIYKILYFIDFDFYEKYEEQLIGATYIKNHYGPTPVEFKAIAKEMIQEKQIILVDSEFFQYPQKKYLAVKQAYIDMLTGTEIKHIDQTINRFADKSAKWLSDYSHEDIPWKTAEQGQAIDYEAVFYRTPETSVRTYEDEED